MASPLSDAEADEAFAGEEWHLLSFDQLADRVCLVTPLTRDGAADQMLGYTRIGVPAWEAAALVVYAAVAARPIVPDVVDVEAAAARIRDRLNQPRSTP